MKGLLLWLWRAHTADTSTTLVALNRGCVETNPLLKRLPTPALVGVKTGVTVGFTVYFGRKDTPTKGDKIAVGIAAGLPTVAAILNTRNLPRCRKG